MACLHLLTMITMIQTVYKRYIFIVMLLFRIVKCLTLWDKTQTNEKCFSIFPLHSKQAIWRTKMASFSYLHGQSRANHNVLNTIVALEQAVF